MSAFKLNKRQIMRKKAAYKMEKGLCVRRELTPEESHEYFTAIFKDRQAVFGIIKLIELNLDRGYPAPRSVAHCMTKCNFLQFALFCRRDDIGAALLRGGADPIALYYDDDADTTTDVAASDITTKTSAAAAVGGISLLSQRLKAAIKATGVRAQFLMWVLRAVLLLQHAHAAAVAASDAIETDSVSDLNRCFDCQRCCGGPVVLLHWPCCGRTVCYECCWTRHILKLGPDGTPTVPNCFLIPDICCPNKNCGRLFSDLDLIHGSPHYKKIFDGFPRDRMEPRSAAQQDDAAGYPRYIMYISDLAREELAEAGADTSPERLHALRAARGSVVKERFEGMRPVAYGRAPFTALPRFISCTQRVGASALQRVTAWQFAAVHGDYCRMYSLAQAGMAADWVDEYGHSALFWAAMSRQYDVIPVLLHFGVDYKRRDYLCADFIDGLWGLLLGSGAVASAASRREIAREVRVALAVLRRHLPSSEDYFEFIRWHNASALQPNPALEGGNVGDLNPCLWRLSLSDASSDADRVGSDYGDLLALRLQEAALDVESAAREPVTLYLRSYESRTSADSADACNWARSSVHVLVRRTEDPATDDHEDESAGREAAGGGGGDDDDGDEDGFGSGDAGGGAESGSGGEVAVELTTGIHRESSNSSVGSHLMVVRRVGTSAGADNGAAVERAAPHPGSKGSLVVDRAFSESFIAALLQALHGGSIPITPASKLSCSDRSYVHDSFGLIRASIRRALRSICCKCGGYRQSDASPSSGQGELEPMVFDACTCSAAVRRQQARYCFQAHAKMRFLQYNVQGGDLAPHVDISKTAVCPVRGNSHTSTHTFIIYLSTSADFTGETAVLESLAGAPGGNKLDSIYDGSMRSASDTIGRRRVLASVSPVRNRLFVFPHDTPHAGLPVLAPPKILLRGELYASLLHADEEDALVL